MSDIIFKTENYVFSYRVAGILIHNGKVLLKRLGELVNKSDNYCMFEIDTEKEDCR